MCKSMDVAPRLFAADGQVAPEVRIRFPKLAKALERGLRWREEWASVHGDTEAQHRLIRKEYGLVEPMSEETKEKLRAIAQSEEYKAKQKAKRIARKRLRAVMKPSKGRRVS